MVLGYMVASVGFGMLNDRGTVDRRALLVGGIAFWSVATALAGLAANLPQLVLCRSLVGVGEAAYGTIAGPYLADFYPPHERTVA
jgi:MFS family permease